MLVREINQKYDVEIDAFGDDETVVEVLHCDETVFVGYYTAGPFICQLAVEKGKLTEIMTDTLS